MGFIELEVKNIINSISLDIVPSRLKEEKDSYKVLIKKSDIQFVSENKDGTAFVAVKFDEFRQQDYTTKNKYEDVVKLLKQESN